MSANLYSQQFKANSYVEVYLEQKFIGLYQVRPTGTFNIVIPYDNGEIFTLKGTSKIGLDFTETRQIPNTHSSDIPRDIQIHDDVHTVTGTSEANSVIRITDSNGNIVGIGTSDHLGKFTVSTAPFSGGEQLNIVATDKDGNVSQPATFTVPQPAHLASEVVTDNLEHVLDAETHLQAPETAPKEHPENQIDLDKIITDAVKEQGITIDDANTPPETVTQNSNTAQELTAPPVKDHSFDELLQVQQHIA